MRRTYVQSGGLRLAALLVAGLGLVALPATLGAQALVSGGGARVAEATVHAGGVDFLPLVRHGGGVVTVTGGGLLFQQSIAAGSSASIKPFDPEGQLLPDGVYQWELELYPDARTAKKLRAAAAENGGRAPGAWERESGSFAVRGGLIADAGMIEAEPSRQVTPADGARLPQTLGAASASHPAAIDVDDAFGSAEESERAASAAFSASAAPAGPVGADRTAPERSDAGAMAMGGSLEAVFAPAAQISAQPVEIGPARNYLIDDAANGRDSKNAKR